jgi:hypothetical protein
MIELCNVMYKHNEKELKKCVYNFKVKVNGRRKATA